MTGTTGAAVEVPPGAYRRDDRRTQRPMARTAWAGELHELVQGRRRTDHQQLADLDRRYWCDTLRLRSADFEVSAASGPRPADPHRDRTCPLTRAFGALTPIAAAYFGSVIVPWLPTVQRIPGRPARGRTGRPAGTTDRPHLRRARPPVAG